MTTKPKRRLKNFNFDVDGAHVALVGKHQGGPANGYTTLVTKATNKIPESFVQKAEEVQVTLSMVEFLRRFFGMWMDDAEVLAKILGYDGEDSEDQMIESYDDYINSKVESVTLLKQLFRAEDVYEALSELNVDQFEDILKDQQMVEKALLSEHNVEKSNENTDEETNEENSKMTDENTDTINKSEVESLIAKALEEKDSELTEVKKQLEDYKEKEAQLVEKSRKEALKDAVKTDEAVETLYKSLSQTSDEDFEAAVKVLKATVDKSDDSEEMFTEKGVDTESEVSAPENDATRKFLEKQYASK